MGINMEKIRLFAIACLCATVSCASVPKNVRNAKSLCYTETHTNIGALININGFFFNHSPQHLLFYDNGLVVSQFDDYNHERWKKNEPKNIPLFFEEVACNPNSKDALSYYDFVDCGNYIISGDTIKVQMVHKSYSINDTGRGKERWYKVIDRNTLVCIKSLELTTDKREKAFIEKSYSHLSVGVYYTFVPTKAVPPSQYYWILKEKWFWCYEQDWKDYMEKIKQKKKK